MSYSVSIQLTQYTLAVTANAVTVSTSFAAAPSETAAGILAKLLTVDGAGSGLDADLLDGLSSAAFATAAQGALAASASQPGHTHAQSDVTGLVTALAGLQPLDTDLTTIAALTATTDSFMQSKAGAWAARTVAQVKADLALTGTNSGDQASIVGITGTKAQFNTAATDGDFLYVGDPPTAHTHLLAAGATDVTITAANLNALDDGVDTTLHFHAADRARANHTGTQVAATISDFSTAADARVVAGITGKQPLATDLTTISGLTPINDDFLQRKAGAWANRSVALVKADLGLTGTNSGDQTIALTGDVTGSGTGSFAATIAPNAVTLSKMAQLATSTFLGRATAATGNVEAMTATQATSLLDAFTSAAKGLAPASGGGTTNFLRADGTWAAPAGGGGGITSLTTDVVASGTGAVVATIQPGVVTLSKMASLAASTIIGNNTGAGATPIALTTAQTKALLAIANTDVSGLGTLSTQSGIFSGTSSGTNTGDQAINSAAITDATTAGRSMLTAATAAAQSALLNASIAPVFTNVTSKPTTVSGYGITDAVARDANGNTQGNNARQGYTTTATAGATTTLTAASTYLQFFTGTLAQTVVLPDVTTLVQGHQYYVRNNGTNLITINSSGGNLIRIVGPATRCMVTCIAITGTTAASWAAMYIGINITDGKVLAVQNNLTLSGTDGTAFTFPAIGGTVAINTAVDNAQSGATYTLALSDANAELSLTNATSCAVSIPLNATVAFPIGTRIPIWADAAGTYTIVGVSGVTLNGISGGTRTGTMTVNISGVRNGCVLRKTGTDTWTVSGAVGAVA